MLRLEITLKINQFIFTKKNNEKNDLTCLRTTKDFDLYEIINEYIKGVIDKDDIINLFKA